MFWPFPQIYVLGLTLLVEMAKGLAGWLCGHSWPGQTWPSRPRQLRHKALVSRPRPGHFGGRVTTVHHYPGAPLDVAVGHSAPPPSRRARSSLLMLPGPRPRLCLVDTSLDAQSSQTRVLSTGSAAQQTCGSSRQMSAAPPPQAPATRSSLSFFTLCPSIKRTQLPLQGPPPKNPPTEKCADGMSGSEGP